MYTSGTVTLLNIAIDVRHDVANFLGARPCGLRAELQETGQ